MRLFPRRPARQISFESRSLEIQTRNMPEILENLQPPLIRIPHGIFTFRGTRIKIPAREETGERPKNSKNILYPSLLSSPPPLRAISQSSGPLIMQSYALSPSSSPSIPFYTLCPVLSSFGNVQSGGNLVKSLSTKSILGNDFHEI